MIIVDERTDRELRIGDLVDYGSGEWLRLVSVESGRSPYANVERAVRDWSWPDVRFVSKTVRVPLVVQWMRPGFRFRRVGVIPR